MESTSTSSSPTNLVDKPDELVSTGDVIRQIHANQQNADHQIQSATIQPPQSMHQTQQKKCLHHRIFDINASHLVNERVAALLQQQHQLQNYQQIQSQTHLQTAQYQQQQQLQPQQIQLPLRSLIPMQQIPQSHILRTNYQQQIQPTSLPLQQLPSAQTAISQANVMVSSSGSSTATNFSIANYNNNNVSPMVISNNSSTNNNHNSSNGGSSNNGNNINSSTNANSTNSNTNSSNNGSAAIHSQNGLVQQMNAALLAERYLLLDLVEGSTLYKCIDVKSHEELVCKVNFRYNFFFLS